VKNLYLGVSKKDDFSALYYAGNEKDAERFRYSLGLNQPWEYYFSDYTKWGVEVKYNVDIEAIANEGQVN